jgi:putative membrane protein
MIAAAAHFPAWSPHPDVWLIVGLLATGYALAIVRIGPRVAPAGEVVTRDQLVYFSLGLLALWMVSDWPVHDIAEKANYSVHMMQHLTFSIVAAPLMLLGTPGWLLRWLLRPEWLFKTVKWLARFLPALILYNLVLVLAHWPAVVDLTLHNGFYHFLAHSVIFVTALIVWLPIVSPIPEIPRYSPPIQMVYLFLQSVVPTIPASFLTFGSKPLYHYYEHVHQLFGLSALDDQRVAGLIMKLGGGLTLWMVITVVFFRWFAEEEGGYTPRRERTIERELRELQEMGTTS